MQRARNFGVERLSYKSRTLTTSGWTPSCVGVKRWWFLLWIPRVPLESRLSQPCVERIVNDESMTQLFVIVAKELRESQGYRQQTGALRFSIEAGGVGAANYSGECSQRWVLELIFRQERIE